MLTLPNLLTLTRIAIIPPLLLLTSSASPFLHTIALVIYALACITDYFDGYIARRFQSVSPLGRFLDPIADKLLVAALLLVLVARRDISGWQVLPATIILCREILVSGLREFLAELRVGLPVSLLAKWKTAAQMVALGFLVAAPAWPVAELPGIVLLWVSAVVTLVTGYDYLRHGLRHMDAS
ncbi:MAG TPA: CDP-diacylglycerol--glycerol-3-phosphate 3-phosphatidyltransferase [Dongiaceae bacterium]|jgi:cardiolipin synthase|nr:CDP-diacylglycerol--glycerol-3-phosphate 3-phosphatidyltransferase [Dongiaceae bacterium]